MSLTTFLVFIWLIGFAVTTGMIYEGSKERSIEAEWQSWLILCIMVLFIWPFVFGGLLLTTKGRK